MKKCPNCSKAIPDGAIYCQYCGRDLRVLPNSGAQVSAKKQPVLLAIIAAVVIFCGCGLLGISTIRKPIVTSTSTQPSSFAISTTSTPQPIIVGATIEYHTAIPKTTATTDNLIVPVSGLTIVPIYTQTSANLPTIRPLPTNTTVYIPPPEQPTQSSRPAGATAICNDGTYSFSAHRRGTCSHHGGVAQWLVNLPP